MYFIRLVYVHLELLIFYYLKNNYFYYLKNIHNLCKPITGRNMCGYIEVAY